MKAQVDNIVATEGYGNTSEFFRGLVREYLKDRADRKLEALILEGISSGEAVQFTKADIDAIRERGIERIRLRSRK